MAEKTTISLEDVTKLMSNPSADSKAAIAEKLGKGYSSELSSQERAIAEDIFSSLIKDVELRVRKALAESLQDNPDIPHDVAFTLAKDEAEVAIPILENSIVLDDEDLKEIISSQGVEAQSAVARRKNVSEELSAALAETGNEEVVATLVANQGAQISDDTMSKVVDEFGNSDAVNSKLATRQNLPLKVAERLVNLVSDKIKDHLVTHHKMSPDTAMDLLVSSREKATIGLLDGRESQDVMTMVKQLEKNGRLTPTIIIRALCMGDANFFNAALSVKSGVPVNNAYQLMNDRGGVGLQKIMVKAGISEKMAPVARAALKVINEMAETGGDDKDMLRLLIIERVLTSCEVEFDSENIDYLIGKLGNESGALNLKSPPKKSQCLV